MIIKNKDDIETALLCAKSDILGKLLNCKDGVLIEISEFKPKRTNPQNNFYWANVKDITEILRAYNVKKIFLGFELLMTDEDVHQLNKMQFNIDTTKKLSKKEFCDFMESLFAFWITETKGKWQPKELTRGYLERTGL